MMANHSIVRIGEASAAWGDSSLATPQLLAASGIDYLVCDYLAETTMAILARQRQKISSDPPGKSHAQVLRDFPVEIPAELASA